MSLLPAVASTDSLVIRQIHELTEVFTDLETKNRYEVDLPDGRRLMYAYELGEGVGDVVRRNILNTMRPFHIELSDERGQNLMHVHRPWRWWFSRIDVLDGNRAPLGAVERRFSIFSRRFSVFGPGGNEIATIHGPWFHPWTFQVLVAGREVGQITKQWSGLLREVFTDADVFGVKYGAAMDTQLRALALAATFLIDFLYFEGKNDK